MEGARRTAFLSQRAPGIQEEPSGGGAERSQPGSENLAALPRLLPAPRHARRGSAGGGRHGRGRGDLPAARQGFTGKRRIPARPVLQADRAEQTVPGTAGQTRQRKSATARRSGRTRRTVCRG